ncbi:DUF6292 family protein [Nonomuraea sp. 3N208]|uniref:DUF6292 family protein n=1 Tax=Nonomuraea sp. 3N208 TaxID=3457421 RepID=UPI003FCFE594
MGAWHAPDQHEHADASVYTCPSRLIGWSSRPTGSDVVTSRGIWRVDWQELHVGYLHDVYLGLVRREIQPSAHWITAFLPRSATIVLDEPGLAEDSVLALAWDEESGWRFGMFAQGDVHCPTLLRQQRYICGDVLPDPADVGDTVLAVVEELRRPRRWWQARESERRWGWPYPPSYRSYRDVRDGFDDRLRAHLPPDDPTPTPPVQPSQLTS